MESPIDKPIMGAVLHKSVMLTNLLEEGTTINSHHYMKMLEKFYVWLRYVQKDLDAILQHNARPHSSRETQEDCSICSSRRFYHTH
ncbi:hypothetical protein JRQ81_005601 [Phrynocephalus forsythii]|uniref:Uncharacterized protein n=1 Tax=Phrynocephalus forsythii TaxID=171643 RepID=A0A9Q1B6R5_9SAUR|nr:hypothetical protein JRQ81_005601 [Phrynocephalus forsythii]